MLDIYLIEGTIDEIEHDETTLENCRDLASLYIVREYYRNGKYGINKVENPVTQELNEILPRYQEYCELKRKYQLGEVSRETIDRAIHSVCLEVKQFIDTLYNNTDGEEERECIKMVINNLYEKYK